MISVTMRLPFAVLFLSCALAADITDPAAARAFKDEYIATTDAWADDIEFTPAELAAMRDGKKWESLMWTGPDDPLANKIIAAGEPSYKAMTSYYPGKILDRTILGTWSDPHQPLGEYVDEFAIYWNGAIAANLIRGRLTDRFGATSAQPLAFNTIVLFRVGPNAEIFGRVRKNYSSIGYEQGYLPIVIATYETNGVRYRETALADKPAGESGGWDIAYVRFEMTNVSKSPRTAELGVEVSLNDGGQVRAEGDRVLDPNGAVLLMLSTSSRKFELRPAQSAQLYLKIPYVPDSKPLVKPAVRGRFRSGPCACEKLLDRLARKGGQNRRAGTAHKQRLARAPAPELRPRRRAAVHLWLRADVQRHHVPAGKRLSRPHLRDVRLQGLCRRASALVCRDERDTARARDANTRTGAPWCCTIFWRITG